MKKAPFTLEGYTLQEIAEAFNPKRSPFIRSAEQVSSESKTIPDDSFTIKELFDRIQKGSPIPLGIERPISYSQDPSHNDLDLSRISRLDISEVYDLKKRVSDTLYHLQDRQRTLETPVKAANDDKTTKTAETDPKSVKAV